MSLIPLPCYGFCGPRMTLAPHFSSLFDYPQVKMLFKTELRKDFGQDISLSSALGDAPVCTLHLYMPLESTTLWVIIVGLLQMLQ